MSVCAASCDTLRSAAPPLAVKVPPAPPVCNRPPAAVYPPNEPLPRTVTKLAGERDAALLNLDGCRNGWNAMSDRYRSKR